MNIVVVVVGAVLIGLASSYPSVLAARTDATFNFVEKAERINEAELSSKNLEEHGITVFVDKIGEIYYFELLVESSKEQYLYHSTSMYNTSRKSGLALETIGRACSVSNSSNLIKILLSKAQYQLVIVSVVYGLESTGDKKQKFSRKTIDVSHLISYFDEQDEEGKWGLWKYGIGKSKERPVCREF